MKNKFNRWFRQKFLSTQRPEHQETAEEQVARYQALRDRAIRIRSFCYAIGGRAMNVWDENNCPMFKRWLWRICNDAQTVIRNTFLDIQAVLAGNPNNYNLP